MHIVTHTNTQKNVFYSHSETYNVCIKTAFIIKKNLHVHIFEIMIFYFFLICIKHKIKNGLINI